jgi:uncharacterized membrane protein SpoIIM required for sporulation
VIIDLKKFAQREKPVWDELSAMVSALERAPLSKLSLEQARRLHYLYERAASALVRLETYSSDLELRQYLENLVARTYSAIYSMDRPRKRFRPVKWFFGTFPRTFRARWQAFAMSLAVTLAGALFGALAVGIDKDSKDIIFQPFPHLKGDPSERVRQEEQGSSRHGKDISEQTGFAFMLMSNNIRVSLLVFALGFTFGMGTLMMLFYNGVILGAVILDYIRAGEGLFLTGWLLPHGSIEIPSVLLAGQAGLVLGAALIGRGSSKPLKIRMREVLGDVVTLVGGVAVLLVWAGIIESFFSQYHYPTVPYWLKIMFGAAELALLAAFLWFGGRRVPEVEE